MRSKFAEALREINFPTDEQHQEMMDRTIKILVDYTMRPEGYEREAEQRHKPVLHVVALYIVGGICSGLEAVETLNRVEARLAELEAK
jgi:hypothetical protein